MEALGLALVGRAMLSKILIQSSTEGWCWAPGLFVVWPKATQFWGLLDFMAWLIMISKRAYTKCPLPGMLLLVPPSPQRAAANPHLHRRPSNTKVSLVQSLGQGVGGGVTAAFPWVLVHTKFCLFVPPKNSVFVSPQSCGSPIIKSHWLSKSDSLGIPSSFAGSSSWEAWHEVQNLQNSKRTSLVLLFSRLWFATPSLPTVGMGFDFIVIASLLQSHFIFFFISGHGDLFWWVLASSCWWFFNN